jgi:hypothetical protein
LLGVDWILPSYSGIILVNIGFSFFAVGLHFIDLLPLHFHFLRERLFGELGSDFQSPLILAERAQYEFPLAEPGLIVAPFWPYFTVLVLPVFGFLTTLVNRFSITFSWLFLLIV